MNINRNNYEEFFLLYVDNELSAAEKNAVDVFVQQNPDLQEELLMLQQSVVKPDAVIFNDKQSLISNDGIPAGLQEKLLLYLDKEADKNDAAFVEQLINTDDAVKKEWNILQQTKLDAGDAVIFNDKHLLYKKESGKVVGMKWWRVAAAALLIGFGIWGAVTFSTKNNHADGLANNQPAKESNKTDEAITSKQTQPAVTKNNSVAVNEDKQNKQAVGNIKPQNKKQQTTITEEKNIAANKNVNNEEQQQTRLEKLNNIESNKNDIAAVTPEKEENTSIKEISNLPEVNENSIPKNEFAVAASFPDGGENIDDGENKKGRSKLGAFFKKIKRTIERKTNTENSDNTIKVANLSFAVQ